MTKALLALSLIVAAPAVARTEAQAGMLTIDDGTPVRVASAAAVRRALARCSRPHVCTSLMLETCDRCIMSAEAHGGGYAVQTRLGPPGPEYDLFDTRRGRVRGRVFTPVQTIALFASYVSGLQPRHVGSIRTADQ